MNDTQPNKPTPEELAAFAASLIGSEQGPGILQIPNGAGGVEAIKQLVNDAQFAELHSVPVEGYGLPENVTVMLRPPGQGIHSIKSFIEEYREKPARITGTAKVNTLQSFIDLVNRHKNDHSVIFADSLSETPSLTAIIDYHTKEHGPENAKHRVGYTFPLSDEAKIWLKSNGLGFNQVEFASFLEDHAAELASPTEEETATYEPLFKERFAHPNEVVELSRHLEIYQQAKVKQGIRLSSGERQIEFTEENMNAKGEKVEVPGLFMVSIAIFVDGETARIPARLRYRVANGGITWSYQLYRAREAIRARVQADMATAATSTKLAAFEGQPEA